MQTLSRAPFTTVKTEGGILPADLLSRVAAGDAQAAGLRPTDCHLAPSERLNEAIYPKPRTTIAAPGHKIYPYLLRDVPITRCNQVWSTDITYIRMARGLMYLTAVIDWYSRYVLAWQLSNTLDGRFCQIALRQALQQGRPEIVNTDQGVQFTATPFTSILEEAEVRISMDGRGRALDNVFIERLWRTVKWEHIYLMDYGTVPELATGLQGYFRFYNQERFHQKLEYRTPAEVYYAS